MIVVIDDPFYYIFCFRCSKYVVYTEYTVYKTTYTYTEYNIKYIVNFSIEQKRQNNKNC